MLETEKRTFRGQGVQNTLQRLEDDTAQRTIEDQELQKEGFCEFSLSSTKHRLLKNSTAEGLSLGVFQREKVES